MPAIWQPQADAEDDGWAHSGVAHSGNWLGTCAGKATHTETLLISLLQLYIANLANIDNIANIGNIAGRFCLRR